MRHRVGKRLPTIPLIVQLLSETKFSEATDFLILQNNNAM